MERFFNGFGSSSQKQATIKEATTPRKEDVAKINVEDDEDFTRKGKDVLQAFIDVATEETTTRRGWKRTKEHKGIVVFEKRRPDSAINLLRFETRVQIDAETLVSFLNDAEFLQRVAPAVFTAKTILRQFDDNHSILHFTFPTVGPIANRDLTTFETSARNVAGFDFVTAARSIEVPSSPPAPGVVRAYVSVTGYGVVRDAETSCKLVHIVHVNPKGALIPMLVNMFQVKPPLEAVVAICAYCADFARKRTAAAARLTQPDKAKEADSDAESALSFEDPAQPANNDEGDSYSHLLERLMDNPSVLDQLMNLTPIKRLIKDSALLKSLMNGDKGGKLTEMFEDKAQLEDLCDMIISGEISMQELTGLLNEMFGYESTDKTDRASEEKDRLKVIEASLLGAGQDTLQFQVLDEHELITPLGAEGQGADADEVSLHGRWTACPLTIQQHNVFQRIADTATANNSQHVQQWCCDIRCDAHQQQLSAADVRRMWQTLLKCHPALRTLLLRVKPGMRRRGGSGSNSSPSLSSRSPSSSSLATSSSIFQVLPGSSLPFVFREVDWSAKSPEEQEREWADLVRADARSGFDLRKLEHLVRVTLAMTAVGEMKLLWTFHAALLDHRSSAVVLAHFMRLVRTTHSQGQGQGHVGLDSPLVLVNAEPEPAQPPAKDPAKREEEEKRFWRETLREIRAPTPLFKASPTTAGGREAQSERHQAVQVRLEAAAAAGLQKLAQSHQVSLETVLLAAWACLLQRCSGGEKRVLFGSLLAQPTQHTPRAGADASSGDAPLLGCVHAAVPTVVDFKEDKYAGDDGAGLGENGVGVRLDAFLRRLDATVRATRERGQQAGGAGATLSISAIQQQSEVAAEYSLFESLFVWDDYTRGLFDAATDGAVAVAVSCDHTTNWQYPLVLVVRHGATSSSPAPYDLTLSYDAGLWQPKDAQRLSVYLSTLLAGLSTAAPAQTVHSLPLLPEDEVRQLVVAHNDNARPYPTDVRIERLFEAQAARTPDQVAITFDELGQALTYRELDRRANQVAHHLLSLNLGKGSLLAIYMTRCVDVVVAIFGVIKAGAAYLPLDPETPKERVWQIAKDANVASIVTQRAKADVLFAGHDGECAALCLDDPSVVSAIQSSPDSAMPADVTAALDANQLIYVIYTSGSTGKPKGVRICHRGLVNQFQYIRSQPGMREGDVILGVSTLSFDIAQLELVLPLTCGAKIVMVSSAIQRDGFRLKTLLEERLAARDPITIMQATPASWRMLCAAGWQGDAEHLRIWCGGEAMTCDLARQLLPRCSALWNMYGPTETTVWASALRVTLEHTQGSSIPVGGKEHNSQFFLLDAYRQLVPAGVLGELYIAGDGVGSYVDPEMTERSFVDNPFKLKYLPHSSDKMFRVGDVLRYKDGDDNTLEFLGRVDHQVKIRGYRIELEEIMNCVYQHRSVKECLVVAREPDYAGGEKYLVAYIIMESSVIGDDVSSAGGGDVSSNHHEAKARMVQELRLLLEERLPAYMVPSHFMVLDKWPLSPNGKVDRTALPSPTRGGQHEVGFNYAAPNTAAERTLVEVFESILHVSPVGVDDDFFALGGNSLLGVSLIGALEGKFGVRFPFSVIFSASTVRHLAVCIGEAHATSAATLLSCGGGRSAKTTEEDERRGRDSYDDLSVIVKGSNAGVGTQQDQQPGLAPPAAVSSAAPTAVLAEKMSAAKRLISSFASPLVPLQTRGPGLPLFVIHPAFKSSVCYGALAYHLGADQPVYGLEPRIEYRSIEAMAADYVAAIRPVQKSGLYNIAGWSFGCTVAYEVARQLQASGDEVNLLLLDGRAPVYDPTYLRYDADALAFCVLCRGAKQYLGFGVDVSYTETAPLSPDERLLNVMGKVIDKNGLDLVPPSVAINFFFRFQRDIRDSEVLSRNYGRPAAPLRGRVTLFRTTGDNDIQGVDDPLLHSRTLGWDQFCEEVAVVDVGGDHESMVFQPTVLEVARKLRPCLAGKSP